MKEQVALQKLLISKYEEIRARNPQFSRRAFSKGLGLSPGAISELFNGQRQVSRKLAEKLAPRLGLDPQERADLFKLFPERKRHARRAFAPGDAVDPSYLQLSADQFRVIGDWYHFAILALMRSKGFKSDPAWIASRLTLSVPVVQGALERMKRLELISQDDQGRLSRSQARYRTSDDVANDSVKRAHLQYLERARDTLNAVPVELRDFTSMMLSLHPSQLPRAKELIRKFQDELSQALETQPQPEVYQLCIQLFPLTKPEKGDST